MAPLAGITDLSFRSLVTRYGADLAFTEMISAKALHYKNKNTQNLIKIPKDGGKFGIQLFGSDADILKEIAMSFNDTPEVAVIDINMGCPAPKIVKNGEGSFLMKDVENAQRIMQKVRSVTKKPLSVKFRRGYEMDNETALEFAKMAEGEGIDYITVHGRYRDQFYSGKSDRDIIKKIKEEVKIPVVANGDIFTGKDAIEVLNYTKADAIMIARGALGNPFIFEEIKCALEGNEYIKPTEIERLDVAKEHFLMEIEEHGENIAVKEMRKHFGWYVKGMADSTDFKNRINIEVDPKKVLSILEEYKEHISKIDI